MCRHRKDCVAVCRHKDGNAVCSAGIYVGKMVILCAGIGGMVISGSAL